MVYFHCSCVCFSFSLVHSTSAAIYFDTRKSFAYHRCAKNGLAFVLKHQGDEMFKAFILVFFVAHSLSCSFAFFWVLLAFRAMEKLNLEKIQNKMKRRRKTVKYMYKINWMAIRDEKQAYSKIKAKRVRKKKRVKARGLFCCEILYCVQNIHHPTYTHAVCAFTFFLLLSIWIEVNECGKYNKRVISCIGLSSVKKIHYTAHIEREC